MGLFDRFGAGGGKLEIHPSALQFSPGQVLEGRVSFTAGSRAQQITSIVLKFNQSLTYVEQTAQGPQQRSRSQAVAPDVPISGAFTSEPGNRYDFPFRIQLPGQMVSSAPQQCHYRLHASADIDNEVDPGDGQDIQIIGGTPPGMGMPGQPMMGAMGGMPGQPMMGGMPGQPMMGGMPGQPMMGGMPGQPMMGGMPGQPMMAGNPAAMMAGAMGAVAGAMGAMGAQNPMGAMGAMGAMPGQPPALVPGTRVLAQWQDGQFHPAVIVSMQNGYVAVDWENPALGASSWVTPQQLQSAPMMGGMGGMPGQPMMGGMPGQPMMGGMPGQPMMGGMQAQPMAQGVPMKPMAGGAPAPMASKAPLGVGSLVHAQYQDGSWQPGRIVAQQNGYHAVDWENPKLGASAWVTDQQVRPR